jgi:UDP:flavonoid glycosyltransferase YjiC (YdhE family)
MFEPVLYIAITGHGFGHAVRAASVAAQVKKLNPEVLLILVTTAPRWLLESYIQTDFIHRPRAFDVGVIQADSFQMDKAATLTKMQQFKQQQNSIIAAEVNYIHTNKVGLILADIPALAAPIAKAAGIPCWMMSNFGWDFIYRAWGAEFSEITDWIRENYQQCDRLFRLPMCESMSAFTQITEVGLTGGTPRHRKEDLQSKFKLHTSQEKTILLTFGGLGLEAIPYQNLSKFTDWQFIAFDRHAPDLPNLIKIEDNQYRPVDFMPLCGRVISKPGYSTFAETLRLEIPLISLTREDFAESPLLLQGIEDYGYHQILSPAEFFAGEWEFLFRDPQPPRQKSSLDKYGAEEIAQAVVNYFRHPS